MIPEVIIEYIWMRGWMEVQEYQFRGRYQKPCSRWMKYTLLIYPIVIDMAVYYTMAHPESFSGIVQRAAKSFGIVSVILTREWLFTSGVWTTLISLAVIDFCMGICAMIRYGILTVLRMPLQYTTDQFQIFPLLLIVILSIGMQFTLIRYLKRFSQKMNEPGAVLKSAGFLYFFPCLFFIRPPEVLNLLEAHVAFMAGVISFPLLILVWVVAVGYYRQTCRENEFLAIQTELFAEHTMLLKEQQEFIEMCRDFLRDSPVQVESLEMLNEQAGKIEKDRKENAILMAALQSKIQQCREKEISVNINVKNSGFPAGVTELQVVTVFYNLFDNAMEAAAQCTKNDRYIQAEGVCNSGSFYFKIRNGRLPFHKRVNRTRSSVHQGLGLRIVRDIVRQMQGTMQMNKGADYFEVEICLNEWQRDYGDKK